MSRNMARIKVTGYLSLNEFDPEELDDEHETGLSDRGFNNVSDMVDSLSDVTITLED